VYIYRRVTLFIVINYNIPCDSILYINIINENYAKKSLYIRKACTHSLLIIIKIDKNTELNIFMRIYYIAVLLT